MQDVFAASDGCLSAATYDWAAQKLQDVVAHRLTALHRSAHRLLGNSADAEDAVQDALLSACKHLDQFRGESQMSTWLTTIVCNCARMQLRRRPRRLQISLDENIGVEQKYSLSDRLTDPGPNPEEQCRQNELARHLMHQVNRLPSVLRKTYRLREVDGLSLAEIARKLQLPVGTVKARLSRARAKLRGLACPS